MPYINTDLDLVSSEDLSELVAAFEARGVFPLHLSSDPDGYWRTSLECETQYQEPEATIAAMLDVVESLSDHIHLQWQRCSKREFNVGYDCAADAVAHTLSGVLIARLAAAGASLGITIYPSTGTD